MPQSHTLIIRHFLNISTNIGQTSGILVCYKDESRNQDVLGQHDLVAAPNWS